MQYFNEARLHYNYFRTYDPSTGRYLESDPIGLRGGLNTYGYALQNPLRYTDPTGESAVAGVLTGLAADTAVPDPSDAAWPKWAAWGVLLAGAYVYDACTDQECPPCRTISGKTVPIGTLAYRLLEIRPRT